jgi:hypothetical protein
MSNVSQSLPDGVAEFWGLNEALDTDVHLAKEGVVCFSLTDNDCLSETAESSASEKKVTSRSLRFVNGVLVKRRLPYVATSSQPLRGVDGKFRNVLLLHLALCFTLTAFLLLYFFFVVKNLCAEIKCMYQKRNTK